MEEEWRDVVGYEGLYEVSCLGNVRSWLTTRGKRDCPVVLRPYKTHNGYLCVKFNDKRHKYIHVLVCKAFHDNPMNLPEVNHKDEDKTNNRADNLEWCTHKYNNNYGTARKRAIETISISINQFSGDGAFIKRWKSATEAGRQLSIWQGAITKCAKGKKRTYKGFIWRYA